MNNNIKTFDSPREFEEFVYNSLVNELGGELEVLREVKIKDKGIDIVVRNKKTNGRIGIEVKGYRSSSSLPLSISSQLTYFVDNAEEEYRSFILVTYSNLTKSLKDVLIKNGIRYFEYINEGSEIFQSIAELTKKELVGDKVQGSKLANLYIAHQHLCLLVDTSGSMMGEPIHNLNTAVNSLIKSLQLLSGKKVNVDLSILSFGSSVNVIFDAVPIEEAHNIKLIASGGTMMGEGLDRAIDLIDKRKRYYKNFGIPYYKPMLVLITDGIPNDDYYQSFQRAVKQIVENKILIIPIGVGNDTNFYLLSRLAINSSVINLKSLNNFSSLFDWLSTSISNEDFDMKKFKNIGDWGEIL